MKRKLEKFTYSSDEDELSYITSNKKQKITKKTNHLLLNNKISSPSLSDDEESLPIKFNNPLIKDNKSINSNIIKIFEKIDKSKIMINKIINANDSIIEIDEIKKISDNIPRADGLVFKDPTFGKKFKEKYGDEWIKNLINRQHILERNPNYNFLDLIAGKIESTVEKIINTEPLDEVIKYNTEILDAVKEEKKRMVVSSKVKQEQIEIIEKEYEKTKLKFENLNNTISEYSKILNKGNLFIDTGTSKSVPKQLYDQGILFILNIENDFEPLSFILNTFFSKNQDSVERTYDIFKEKMKLIRKQLKLNIKELFPKDNIIINFDNEKDPQKYEFFYYIIVLIFKYYLNCNYIENNIALSPKIRLLQRLKYITNNNDYKKKIDTESIIDILNKKYDKKSLDTMLNKKHEQLKKEYDFSLDETEKFDKMINGSVKLIDLIYFNENWIGDYKWVEWIDFKDFTDLGFENIFKINWEKYYGLPFINLTNFFVLFTPLIDKDKIINNTQDEFNKTEKIIYDLCIMSVSGADKAILTQIFIKPKEFKEEYIEQFLKQNKPDFYTIYKRIQLGEARYDKYLILSYYLYQFFMNYPNSIQSLIYSFFSKDENKYANIINTFLNYYEMRFVAESKIKFIPFIIDKFTIKYMKELYYISMNYYLFKIVQTLLDDHIIEFSKDIEHLIDENIKKDIELNIDTEEFLGEEEEEFKIDSSFYKKLNDLMKNIEIKIIDKSFQKFLNSFSDKGINDNLKQIENIGKGLNTKLLKYYSELPTKYLNIKNQYKGNDSFINLHIYYYLYIEYLKLNSQNIKNSLQKMDKSISNAKKIITDIASEKINIQKIEDDFKDTYIEPLKWKLDPLNSGFIIINPSVRAAINHALTLITDFTPNLRDITLPVIILATESGLTIKFVELIGDIITKQKIRTPSHYYTNQQQNNNLTYLVNDVFKIIKEYKFVKYSNNNQYLGTLYFRNRNWKIKNPDKLESFVNKQINIAF